MSLYRATVLGDNPALYWRLGEPSGTNANDETANNRDGTYVNAPTLAVAGAIVGESDTAVSLNGTDEYLTSTYQPYAAGSVRTFEGWAYWDAVEASRCLFGSSGSGQAFQLNGSADTRFYPAVGGGTANWAAGLTAGVWTHFALTYDDATGDAELFLNGVSQGVQDTGQAYAANANLWVGTYNSTQNWNGDLDEFAVYERILTQAEIREHYLIGKGELHRLLDQQVGASTGAG